MHAVSFSTWCRKDGVHETKAVRYRDWNQELLEPVKKTLAEVWQRWEQAVNDCKEILSAYLHGLLDSVRNDLNGRYQKDI